VLAIPGLELETNHARADKHEEGDGDAAYQEAEVESGDDGGGDGEGRELAVAEVAGEGLADHVHAVERQAHEHGRADDLPQLLGLLPHLLGQPSAPLLLRQLRDDERDAALVALHVPGDRAGNPLGLGAG
jgi:hypothetical protein